LACLAVGCTPLTVVGRRGFNDHINGLYDKLETTTINSRPLYRVRTTDKGIERDRKRRQRDMKDRDVRQFNRERETSKRGVGPKGNRVGPL
jgi:hypothetical protein